MYLGLSTQGIGRLCRAATITRSVLSSSSSSSLLPSSSTSSSPLPVVASTALYQGQRHLPTPNRVRLLSTKVLTSHLVELYSQPFQRQSNSDRTFGSSNDSSSGNSRQRRSITSFISNGEGNKRRGDGIYGTSSSSRSSRGSTSSVSNRPDLPCCSSYNSGSSRRLSGRVCLSTMPNIKRKRENNKAPQDRPSKQMRPETNGISGGGAGAGVVVMKDSDDGGATTPVDLATANGGVDEYSSEDEPPAPLVPIAAAADTAEWQKTIERVVRNVVSIHFCQTCSFDTDAACSSEATGFIVDAERGYILTNRHVVSPGPFWGFAIFDNHEECDVQPVYRDPIHDFGILRFDPKKIKYMKLEELTLRPDLAKVGSEIRVVGNDAGEKLSILSGVISRLDRNAPEYGEGYSDFNTNYIQAAAAASGGSSGSPVVNVDGHAVALQAGGRSDGAATDYFLPLDRPSRALRCIREGKPVTRGTIQTQWMMKAFDECRRLGLKPEWEATVRKHFPKETNMLVAEIILPGGPAHGKIQEGDVLIKVNDELLTQFVRLDDILDTSVAGKVKLLVQRGGEDLEVELEVGDLHTITPDRFVTVAGGAFHDLSYQQARLYAIATKGVYVCESGGSFRFETTDSGWIIESIDHQKTPDMAAFVEVMKKIPDRSRVVVTYKHLRDLHTLNTSIIHVDRHWQSKMRMATRNDETGLWDFEDIADALPPVKPERKSAQFAQLDATSYPGAADIVRSFVRVACSMPVKLDGFPRARKVGYGLVVDAEKGLVLVSRAIVPYDLCDLSITIADSIIVEGKVVFLHPLANYAIIQYDPGLVDAPIKSAKLSTNYIKQGASTVFLGFNQNLRTVHAKTTVTDITTVAIPANTAAPRYRALNLDAVTVDSGLSAQCGTGVLVSEDGTVDAIWLTYLGERAHGGKDNEYHLGLATPGIIPIIEQVRQGKVPDLRILDLESTTVQMSQARIMGVSEAWIQKVAKVNPFRHQLFMVRKADCPATPEAKPSPLNEGDIILTLNGRLITNPHDLDIMYGNEVLEAQIVREGKEMTIQVPTISTADLSTDHALAFCGAILHAPHHAVRQQISQLHSHVYVSARTRGSPAYMYGLAPTNFITAVNGVPIQTLDDFKAEVMKIPDNTYFRLRVVTFDNVPWVATMKKNEHYFPTCEFVRESMGKWDKRAIKAPTTKGDTTGVEELGSEIMDEGPGVGYEGDGEV